MEKEFVKYNQALALKELGFDEPCFMCYYGISRDDKFDGLYLHTGMGKVRNTHLKEKEKGITAPLYQQAFRWFREKYTIRHNIMDFIDDETGIEWDYEIATIGTDLDKNGNYKSLVGYSMDDESRKFKTYEEAESACLDKLIEIVKNK